MYRQHPYAGYGAPPAGRRNESPPGLGPERSRGFTRGGRGRRGGPSGSIMPYGSGISHETSFGSGFNDNANPYADSDTYNLYRTGDRDEFDQFESNADGFRRGARAPPPRREADDKVHDSLIEERLQRERPCRTLFIRNIKYETDSAEFQSKFEEFGDIKTFFDLISHRGMVFCTYFDMRSAERAKERLQGTELAGRPIDVHYSLPRESRDDAKADKNQGIIVVTLIDSPSRAPIDDVELRRKFGDWGDIKSILPYNGRNDARLVEYYDLRASEEAYEKLRHQSLQDGIIETEWFEPPEFKVTPGPAMQERARQDKALYPVPRGGGRGRGRGVRGRGGGGYEERRGGRGEWEEDEYYHRERGRMSPRGYDDRYRDRSPPPRGRSFNEVGPDRDKLEQAKRVQDLLASLKHQNGAQAGDSSAYVPGAGAGGPLGGSFGAPANNVAPQFSQLGHLAALLQQAAQVPGQAQAANAALNALQYSNTAPPLAPPLSSGPPLLGPLVGQQYGYPPAAPQPSAPAPTFTNDQLFALLAQNQARQLGTAAPPLPPDTARYNYGPTQTSPPPPPAQSSSGTAAQSIQDIMALLKPAQT